MLFASVGAAVIRRMDPTAGINHYANTAASAFLDRIVTRAEEIGGLGRGARAATASSAAFA
jgi:hypothetical protein